MLACTPKQNLDSAADRETEDKGSDTEDTAGRDAYRITKTVSYNDLNVDVIIDKPRGTIFDVLVVYHGTVWSDQRIHEAATRTLNEFSRIVDRDNMMIVSVVYPEENLLMGSNIVYAEAGLLWVQHTAPEALGIEIDRLFLGGHSQGGYLVTRLNTMHPTDGVIANSPGPLDMRYRCQREEEGTLQPSHQCQQLLETYGTTADNPEPYDSISLLRFTSGHTSPLLLVQGMADAAIQLHSWPAFKEQMLNCTDCASVQVIEAPGAGHPALFQHQMAIDALNDFVR